jgi:hypothetical protein
VLNFLLTCGKCREQQEAEVEVSEEGHEAQVTYILVHQTRLADTTVTEDNDLSSRR